MLLAKQLSCIVRGSHRDTRPGSPIGDVVFHCAMTKMTKQLEDWLARAFSPKCSSSSCNTSCSTTGHNTKREGCSSSCSTTCSTTGNNTKREEFSRSCSSTCSTTGNSTKFEECSSSCKGIIVGVSCFMGDGCFKFWGGCELS